MGVDGGMEDGTIEGMYIFGRKKRRVSGVVDVGSDAIKALLFEYPENEKKTDRGAPVPTLPRPIEKFVWDLPESYTGVRLARKIREGVFRMVQRLEYVPEQILIAVGPTVAECRIRLWRVAPDTGATGKILIRRDIREAYRGLFEQETDQRRAVIATPVELLVNGYPLAWQENWHTEAVLARARAKEIAFRVLTLAMPVENGATFLAIKQALGGMPIEFLPLVAAEKEAMVRGLGVRDAFVVDIGGNETTLLLIRDGRFAHAAFIPYGTRRFSERFARKTGHAFGESQKYLRQYLQAAPGHKEESGGLREIASAIAAAVAARWKALFVASLSSFALAGPIPPDVFLTGGGAHFPVLREAVQSSDWLGSVSYAQVPVVRVLEGHSFFGGDTLGGYLQGPEDAGLAALMVYATGHQPMF